MNPPLQDYPLLNNPSENSLHLSIKQLIYSIGAFLKDISIETLSNNSKDISLSSREVYPLSILLASESAIDLSTIKQF